MDSEEGDRFQWDSEEDYDDYDELEQLIESDDEVQDPGKDVTDYSAQKSYKILKPEEIKKIQENDISDVINVLSVSRSVACTLLCQHRWYRRSVYESWFDENRYAETQFAASPKKEEKCGLCCRTEEAALSGVCRHLFCARCWRNHILRWKIEGCLQALTCPEPGCKTDPGFDMVNLVSLSYDKANYYHVLCQSYVDSSPNRKWCPNKTCNLAIEFEKSCLGESETENYEVSCDCGYKWCWSCGQEGHSPLDCATVAKWVRKNETEADSATWIVANTKPCPKCHRVIQNEGSKEVTCGDPCGYKFCWKCLTPMGMGHDYAECLWVQREKERADEEERVSKKRRIDDPLERYVHYYQRFDSNDKLQKRASAGLTSVRPNEPRLWKEVWGQIEECRRVLKWSYAYGYYLSESGSGRLSLFEHLLEEAEASLERLQNCADKEMSRHTEMCRYTAADAAELKGLILVAKKYFENLAAVGRREFSFDN